MAIDEAILLSVESGETPSTIRLYRWEKPSISIGYRQGNLRDSLDFPIVRRLTGGKTVFHDDEYTISVVASYEALKNFDTLLDSYLTISRAILAGLNILGIRGTLAPRKSASLSNKKTHICFEVTSTYEITVDGEKIVGSAQRRFKDVFMQQSSIPFYIDLCRFPTPSEIFENTRPLNSPAKVAFLKKLIPSFPDEERIVQAFKNGFEHTLGVELEEGSITLEEEKMSSLLREEKYTEKKWNYYRKSL